MNRRTVRQMLMVAGAVAAVALLIVAFMAPRVAAAGWLIAFNLLSVVPLGALAWLMIHRLTGGHWGDSVRPLFEIATAAIPLLVPVFVPVLAALALLFPWVAGAEQVKRDVASLYLNIPLFVLRTAVAMIGWSVLAIVLPRVNGRAGLLLAGLGLAFHALTVSLVSVDWILSTEPVFISTSFGATIVITQLLAALGFAVLFAPELDDRAVGDLGGLMLTATLGVTYLNFMAVLVIWYGDLPTKVSWFAERLHGPWTMLAWASFVLGSMLPILSLLLSRVRRSRIALRYVAVSSLAGIALYFAWLLAPAYGAWTLATAALGVIALCCAFVVTFQIGWPAALFHRARTAA